MELEQAQKRVKELRAVIEKNNRLYYDQDAPELEDFEYDALTRELKELEAVPAAGHTQLTDAACRRDPQRTVCQGHTCGQNGKSVGCVFV